MRITYLPHARRRMEEGGISEEVERVVVTVELGLPTRLAGQEGGEQ